jgi:hypothetical protein
MKVAGSGFTMSYTNWSNSQLFIILPYTNFQIEIEKVNYSELLSRYYMTKQFDFEDLDISQKMKIKFSPFRLSFTQEVYTYFLRCNDLNIAFSD